MYNVSKTTAASREAALSSTAAPPPPPPPGTEGSGNSGFAVVVNGVKIFGRGANLVPFELLEAAATPAYIRRTMQSVHDGGMNMIRVWGGGMYQDDVFYEECDRLGITIYHDMAFSFRLYPHDPGFQDNVKAELADQIGRLRSHPSIVIWDTSNEDDADPEFFYDTVLTSIAQHDATRPLWPSSPSSGFATGVDTATGLPNGNKLRGRFQAELDTHQPYDYCGASFVTSQKLADGTYFKSEFGQVSLPAFETLAPALNGSAGDFAINSPILVHRKHACGSPRDPDDPPSGSACINDKNLGYPIASLFGETDFADRSEAHFRRLIFLSQLAQTLCIKTKLEEFRRGSETFGALIWQLNDVWQASSWGSLDYGGRWRALHHSLQAIFAPTLASVFVDAGTLRVYASHHGSALTGADKAQLELNITNVATGAARSRMHTLSGIQGKSAAIAPVASLPLASLNPATEVVTTRLMMPTNGGGLAPAETVHLLSPPANMSWVAVAASDVALTVGPFRDGRAVVTLANNAKAPMFFALLTSTRQGTFSRNLLLVPPGEARDTEFVSAEGAAGGGAAAGFKESLHLDWLNRAA